MESIWNFKDNEAIETEKIDLKPFKPTGKFFDDVQAFPQLSTPSRHDSASRTLPMSRGREK